MTTTEAPTGPAAPSARIPTARTQGVAIVTAAFGQNIILTTVTTFILAYLVNNVGISTGGIAVVTIIITLAKVVDAVSDPLVGSLIDRTRSRWGKLRPWVLFSAVPVAILTALLFSVPDVAEPTKLVFFGVCYLLWGIAYSACDVPLWGLIGSAFGDSKQRAGVVGRVRAFGAVSLGLATLGMPLFAFALSFSKNTTASGWSRAVLISAAAGMALYLLAFFFVRERAAAIEREKHERLSFRQLFGTLLHNTPLLMVLFGSILGFGRFIVQAGGAVFVVIAYKQQGYFTYIGAAIILGLVIASFLTPLLLRRTTGKRLAIISSLAAGILYTIMFFAGFASLPVVMVFIFLTGLTLGIFFVVQATMIADAVDDVEQRTGVRNDGISFATLTFVSKLMTALAVLVFGLFIVIAGYEKGVHITAAMQNTIWISITIVPAISCLVSSIPFFFYRLGGPRA